MIEPTRARRPAAAIVLAVIAGVLAAGELGGPAWGWGLGASALAVGALCARGRARSTLAFLAIALLGGCRFVDAERAAEQRVALLRAADGALEAHLVGRVLRAAEPSLHGEHLLSIRGRVEAKGGPLTVRLRIRRSSADGPSSGTTPR